MASKADSIEEEKRDTGTEKESLQAPQPTQIDDDDIDDTLANVECVDHKRLKHEWTQTVNKVQICIDVCLPLTGDDVTQRDFHDDSVYIQLADGRHWTCKLNEPIHAEESRVFFKYNKLVILLVKQVANEWPSLQAKDPGENNGAGSKSAAGETPAATPSDTSPENQKKDEEPILIIDHAKNTWFETNDLMTVHVYVKEINKDSLTIVYKEKMVAIKFQTSETKFLELNKVKDKDTSFLWKIPLKGEIEPSRCKHKLSPSKVELLLRKRICVRWGALEAPMMKGSQSAPVLNIWQPATQTPDAAPKPPPPPPAVSPISFAVGKKAPTSSPKMQSLSSSIKARSRAIFGQGSSSESDEETPTSSKDNKFQTEKSGRKPTCMVSPLNKAKNSKMITSPGMTGLDNIGNTCFMNSTLQILANTKELREFFLSSSFQKDINTDNPLGCGGQLAVAFAVLLKVLWAGTQYSFAPSKLKNLVASKNSQFSGLAQHDAQEFLAFLLDGLHEDLNRIKRKPYIENKDSDDRADEVVANEQWEQYKKRNDSFIVDLFQGQYKSTLVCPKCNKVSITFDPYMYLSVPIPKKKMMIPVFFVSKDLHTKPVRFVLPLPRDSHGADLKKAVSQRTGIPVKDLRAFEAYKGRFHRFFERTSDLNGLASSDIVFVFEVLSEELAGEPVVELNIIQRVQSPTSCPTKCSNCQQECSPGAKLKRCTKCFRVGYCDQRCQRDHWQLHKSKCRECPDPVGQPFIVSLPRSKLSYSRLAQMMQAFSIHSVDVFQPPVSKESLSSVSSEISMSDYCESTSDTTSMNSSESDLKVDLASENSGSSTPIMDNETIVSRNQRNSDIPCTVTKPSEGDECLENQKIFNIGTDSNSFTKCDDMLDNITNENSRSASPNLISLEHNDDLDNFNTKRAASPNSENNLGPPDDSLQSTNLAAHSTRVALGLPQVEPAVGLSFWMKPVNQQGHGLPAPEGARLIDQGESPLGMSSCSFLAMDWKNNDRSKHYVLVQTKDLDFVEDADANNVVLNEKRETTLQQCLQLFSEAEVLSPEEAWYCPRCKKHVEASKQMAMWRFPHTLIIHLKRFSFRNFIWRDKIDRMVDYPVNGLDMSEFFIGKKTVIEPPPIYDLYGVVNHHGGILGGHYTSYGRLCSDSDWKKNEMGWRLFDDSRVSHANPNNVVTRAGYVLFYRRRHCPLSLPGSLSEATYADDKKDAEKSEILSSEEDDISEEIESNQGAYGYSTPTVNADGPSGNGHPPSPVQPDVFAGGDAPNRLNEDLQSNDTQGNGETYAGPSYTDMDSVD